MTRRVSGKQSSSKGTGKPCSPTAVDLFAGAGGFSVGLLRAGFDVVLANEFSVDPEWTYRYNLLQGTREGIFPALPADATEGSRKAYRAKVRERILSDRKDLSTNFSRRMRGGDIRSALPSEWLRQWKDRQPREVDLVVAGPPCQGFSCAGNSCADDERNELVYEAIRVIRQLRPRIAIIENVPGMLERHSGLIEEIGLALSRPCKPDPGYYVLAELVHGEPLGVPQTRRRLLLVGVRRDLVDASSYDRLAELLYPVACPQERSENPKLMGEPVPAGSSLTATEVLGDLAGSPPVYGSDGWTSGYRAHANGWKPGAFLREVRAARTTYLAGGLAESSGLLTEGYFNHEASAHLPSVAQRLGLLRTAASSSPESRQHRCSSAWLRSHFSEDFPGLVTKKSSQRVLLPDEWPMLTVTSLPDDIVHHEEDRIPTVREVARLQTFPDWYQFAGVRTTGAERRRAGIYVPQYSQVANAVPPRLAHAVATRIRQFLAHLEEDKSCQFEIEGGRYQTPNIRGSAFVRLAEVAEVFRQASRVP